MADDVDLILKFEIVPGRNPTADNAARALAAWVDMLEAAAAVVEPGAKVRVELVGVEEGSQKFKLALRKIEDAAGAVVDGAKDFPIVSKAAIALGGLIVGTAITVAVTDALSPDPRIPEDQMEVFRSMEQSLIESTELHRENMKFYGVVQEEPAYDKVVVLNRNDRQIYSVPRSEFAARSGVWATEDNSFAYQAQVRNATWDVILIKPVLMPVPRRWRFVREGLEFSALMQDASILQAIHDRTLPIQIAEGVMMKVEVQYREIYDGRSWLPVVSSYKIKRVLQPLPPGSSGPLFLDADAPKK